MVVSYLGRGIAHELAGEPCQDAIRWRISEHGALVMALSDGAGRARWAKEAAQWCTEAVTHFFSGMPLASFAALPEEEGGALLLDRCRASLQRVREELVEADIRHFSATVVFAVADGERLLVGNLGDGMAVVLEDSGKVVLDFRPESGPMGGNSTWFVTSSGAEQHLRMRLLDRSADRAEFLALTSDGILEMLSGRGDGDPIQTIRELWSYIRSGDLDGEDALADALNQMAELTDERMDDWSMLLWWPEGEIQEESRGPVCRSMLQEEEEKYGIAGNREPED